MKRPAGGGPDPGYRRILSTVAHRARPALRRAWDAVSDPFAKVRSIDGPELVPIPRIETDPDPARPPRLVVLLPSLELDRMTGGPNTAINIGARLAARGHDVEFVATDGEVHEDLNALRRHVTALGGRDIAGETAARLSYATVADPSGVLRVGRRDVLMATFWPTAHIARAALAATDVPAFIYLIQDYEPAFAPWSTKYVLAEQTYGFPIRAIFNESLLREHLAGLGVGPFGSAERDRYSIAFEPAVDRELFRPRERTGPKQLLFYARPKNPRNAFELGLRALRLAAAEGAFGPDWEVFSIGSQVPDLRLDAERTIRAVPWQSMRAYGERLGRSDVLISLMLSPHTSYPTLEMARAGGAVVTNTFGVKTAEAMRRISPSIRAVRPEVEALAAAIAEAAADADRQRTLTPPSIALPGDWAEALGPVVDWLEATLADLRPD